MIRRQLAATISRCILGTVMLLSATQCAQISKPDISAPREAIFVTNLGGNYVTVHDLNSVGNAAPLANIRGTLPDRALSALVAGGSGLNDPLGIAVDPLGQIYIADLEGGANYTGEILIFAPGSSGSAKPLAKISGADTALRGYMAIAVDALGNVYATSKGNPFRHLQSAINVYSAGGSGDLTPNRVIGGPHTALMNTQGVAVDAKGKIFVSNNGMTFGASVLVFPPGSNGDVAPQAVIPGPAGATLSAITLDSRGNVYVIAVKNSRDFKTINTVVIYAAANSGYRTIATIAGDRTGLVTDPGSGIGGIAVDSSGSIYVTWGGGRKGDKVMVYAAGSNGDASPRSIIEGPHTMLNGPCGIAIGPYP